jgi:hypothetical protein
VRRREFITLLGCATAAWPLAARAQQAGKVWRVGILGPSPNTPGMIAQHQAFLAELNALGAKRSQGVFTQPRPIGDIAEAKFSHRKMTAGPHSVGPSFLLCSRHCTARLARS